jgi:hypothetical protein
VIYDNSFNINDYYTRISSAWDNRQDPGQGLESWLDPSGSGVFAIDGYLPTGHPPSPGSMKSAFRIYPNPARDILYVEHTRGGDGEIEFKVHDIGGNLVGQGTLVGYGSQGIPVSDLSPGIYFLSLTSTGSNGHLRFLVVP